MTRYAAEQCTCNNVGIRLPCESAPHSMHRQHTNTWVRQAGCFSSPAPALLERTVLGRMGSCEQEASLSTRALHNGCATQVATAGAQTRRAPPSRIAHETQRAIKANLERQLRAQLDESYAPATDAPGELWPTPLASPTPGGQTPGAARLNSLTISLADCEIQVRSIASFMDRLSDVFSAEERASLKREAVLLSLQGRLRVSTDD